MSRPQITSVGAVEPPREQHAQALIAQPLHAYTHPQVQFINQILIATGILPRLWRCLGTLALTSVVVITLGMMF
jgi:hypothetical protein